jgi:YegS/Rv2252/BmrU family lipid kinase
MQNKTVFLVLNPVSGLTQPDVVQSRFEAVFQAEGWSTRVYQTTGQESVAEVVRQALVDGAEMVVAAGGDGTISAASSGMTYSNVPLGILPTGTWNALAHNLGIPILFEDALQLLVTSQRRIKMDALEINGRDYLLNVGVGLSAAVIQNTQRQQKRKFGFLAYAWNLIAQMTGLRLRQYRLGLDGCEVKLRASELMVVNSSILGLGELPTVLDIHPDDGRVEIIAICAPTVISLIGVALNFLIGRRKQTPGFLSFSAAHHITIRARQRVVVQADGEIIGHTPLEIRLRPGAVDVIVPEG